MGYRIGFNAKAYYLPLLNPAGGAVITPAHLRGDANSVIGATGKPSNMVELGNITDASLDMETEEADVTTRRGNGWRQKVGTLRAGSLEFQMVWDPDDPDFSNFQHAFFNQKPIVCGFFDGDLTVATVGYRVQGLYAEFSVLNFSRTEDLADALRADVKLSVAPGATTPQWLDRKIAP